MQELPVEWYVACMRIVDVAPVTKIWCTVTKACGVDSWVGVVSFEGKELTMNSDYHSHPAHSNQGWLGQLGECCFVWRKLKNWPWTVTTHSLTLSTVLDLKKCAMIRVQGQTEIHYAMSTSWYTLYQCSFDDRKSGISFSCSAAVIPLQILLNLMFFLFFVLVFGFFWF